MGIDGIRCVITFNLLIPDSVNEESTLYTFPSFEESYHRQIVDAISKSKLCKNIPSEIIFIISVFLGNFDIIPLIKQCLNDDTFQNDKLENAWHGHREDEVSENGICLILSHRYHGKEINPKILKGKDMNLYMIFKRHFGVYLTPMIIKSVIGEWSDEYEDEKEAEMNGWEGRIINEWNENDDATKWNIVLGKEWWNDSMTAHKPKNLKQYQSKFIVLYNNKKQTLSNAKYVNGGEEYYGNCGSYDIENQYHGTMIVLTKTKNIKKTIKEDEKFTVMTAERLLVVSLVVVLIALCLYNNLDIDKFLSSRL